MTWRLRITHDSGYSYDTPARASYNEVRITPMTTERQLTLDAAVTVAPSPSGRILRYWDYWGTVVHAFDLHPPHDALSVAGRSLVETNPATRPADCAWAQIDDADNVDKFTELLAPTVYVPLTDDISAAASDVRTQGTPGGAVFAAVDWVRGRLAYQPGTTGVHTTALEALRGGQGVCQDFAHLTLAVVRAAGIPARYASGYFYSSADAAIGEAVTGESHAWVEVWTGSWWGVDPTNGVLAGERHVLVGRGRDYADVPPLKGIYTGGGSTALGVSVQLTRVA
ncbi:MAG TPA: transglutaminase family protein [Acidimicrobiales bacterium]|nr:transglutaminase family protein [Acidimicrobiales bacterium]